MGTNTDFTGAIRITPCIAEPLASRLNEFMDIRHMKRDISKLHDLYPTVEGRKPHSLLDDGDFGVEGAFFLPTETADIDAAMRKLPLGEGLVDNMSLNTPPTPCPSLYCDLLLCHDRDNNCSYIGWNDSEKSYHVPEWIALIAELLVARGYHLDGKMFAVVDGGIAFYQITVQDNRVETEDFTPETTYEHEFNEIKYEE